jgi:hypothetical protein
MTQAAAIPTVFCPECADTLKPQGLVAGKALLFCSNGNCSQFFIVQEVATTPVELTKAPE